MIPNVNQITSTLRGMPDSQLQQYAVMHKNDPYILSLAIQESNSRQQLRSEQMAKMAGQQPPTVAEQDIAKMTQPVMPPQMPQGMPPQGGAAPMPQGAPIAQAPQGQGLPSLPTQNLQGMADGGIVGYDKGGTTQFAGSDPTAAYRQYAMQRAQQMGISPYLADSIFKIESGYDPQAKSPTGPVGIGQLSKLIGKSYGAPGDDRKDPYKNIDASLAYMADLQKKYGNDSAKIAVAYNQGEPVLNKHLQDNDGQIKPNALPKEAQGYLKKLSGLLTAAIPIGSAQAAQTTPAAQPAAAPGQRVANGYVVDQFGIPLYKVGEKPNTTPAPDQRNIFEKGADYLGLSPEFQRNASNTLNALSGFSAPAQGVARVAQELEATPKAVAAAAAAAQKANTLRLAPPVSQGITALTPEAQALRVAADNARRARLLAEDQKAARGAEASVKAADTTATAARAAEDATAAERANAALRTNQAVQAAQAATAANALAPTETAAGSAEPVSNNADEVMKEHGAYLPDAAPEPESEGIAALPTSEDKKDSGFNMSNEDMFNMGMALLAGKSQYALQNVGEAGLAMAQLRNQRQRQAAEIAHMNAQARQANAYADIAPARADFLEARTAELASRVPPAQKQAFNMLQAQAKTEEAAISLIQRGPNGAFDPQVAVHQANLKRIMDQMTAMAGNATMVTQAPAAASTVPNAPDASAFKIVGTRPVG